MSYHLNPKTGNPGPCLAELRPCPYGNAPHYDSRREAMEAYEASQSLPPSVKKKLNEAQYSALRSYQGGEFKELHECLRQDLSRLTDRQLAIVEGLDEMFQESHDVAPQEVYRVVYTGEDYLEEQLYPGQLIYEEGYLSTSESEDFVEDCFDHGMDGDEVNTLLTIETDPNVSCIRPRAHTYNHDHEEELLFPRGVVFEVLEDDREGSRRYIRLRMVKHDPDPIEV